MRILSLSAAGGSPSFTLVGYGRTVADAAAKAENTGNRHFVTSPFGGLQGTTGVRFGNGGSSGTNAKQACLGEWLYTGCPAALRV